MFKKKKFELRNCFHVPNSFHFSFFQKKKKWKVYQTVFPVFSISQKQKWKLYQTAFWKQLQNSFSVQLQKLENRKQKLFELTTKHNLRFLAFGKNVFKFAIQITVISSYKVFLIHMYFGQYDILNSISPRKLWGFLYYNT